MNKILFIMFFLSSIFVKAQERVPVLNSSAADYTGKLSVSELESINNLLKDFEKSDSISVVFLHVKSLRGCSVREYIELVIKENKIGQKEYFDGVIFFFSDAENEKTIYPSFRYENIFPPALASSIIRNRVNPRIEGGEYFKGVKAGIEAIILNLRGQFRRTKPVNYDPDLGIESHRGLIELIILALLTIPWFFKKSRGLGTLFSLRTLSGRKRFLPGLVSYYGFEGELRYFYGPLYGLFRRGGPIKGGAHLFKGKIISGKW